MRLEIENVGEGTLGIDNVKVVLLSEKRIWTGVFMPETITIDRNWKIVIPAKKAEVVEKRAAERLRDFMQEK